MARVTTTYDLLFSCPGDVSESCLPIIKDAVEVFNKTYGALNNVIVMVKHWSTDSFPQSGDAPQELLNEQFIRDCDAAVAVFWTRFGTPTEKYESGTEEEIEEMISAGKQVFLYFMDKPMPPSQLNSDEYKKVQKFKEKYKDRGIYWVVKDEQQLQQQFTTHLGLYFLQKITEKIQVHNAIKTPLLSVTGENGETELEVHQFNLSKSELIESKRRDIITKIDKAKGMVLPERTVSDEKSTSESESPVAAKLTGLSPFFNNSPEAPLIIKQSLKDAIHGFCNENEIAIDDYFWNIGDLSRKTVVAISPFGASGDSLIGSDEEKDKYRLMEEIEYDVLCYGQYREFFKALDCYPFGSCIVNNSGTMHDEDIDVKICIPKGFLLPKKEIPIPGVFVIDEINELEFAEKCFCRKTTVKIDSYTEYPVDYHFEMPDIQLPFQRKNATEEIEKSQRKYSRTIDRLFCYSIFAEDDIDVLEFNIGYLKQHKSVYFPTLLFFKGIPEYFDYEIRSENSGEIVQGRITFKT